MNDYLEKANDDLTNHFNDEVLASEDLKAEIHRTNARFSCLRDNFEEIQSELNNSKHDLKQLEEKHTKTCEELKRFKREKEDLEKENKSMHIAMKTLKKESKTSLLDHEKLVKKKDDAIKELLE